MMELEPWIVTNGYTFALLLLLFFVNRTPGRHMNTHALTYTQLLLMVIGLLVADTFSRLPETDCTLALVRFGTYFIFAFDSVGYYFAVRYIESWINGERRPRESLLRNGLLFYSVVNIILVTIAQIAGTGWFYAYPDGVYARGPLYLPRGIGNLLFCVAVEIYIFMRRKQINSAYRPAFYCFPLFVLLGGFMQISFKGIQFEYAGTTMALLLLYVQVHLKDADQDYLTGALSRRMFESVLEQKISSGKPFGGIMADVDYFKTINDRYGHTAGDKALKEVARALKTAFPQKALVGRYGGDEFIVLFPAETEEDIEDRLSQIRKTLSLENARHRDRPYALQLSLGGVLWAPESGSNMDTYLKALDKAMYEDKERHHATR